MPNDPRGSDLQSLFKTDVWQDCFAALSESLGFSLNIFSRDGKLLYGRRDTAPFCHRLKASTPGLISCCETHCRPIMKHSLETGKPDVFTCYLKVVSFVAPIRHKEEHAVILGQGSFSSLDDFHAGMNHVRAAGLDVSAMTAPTVFTSYPKAWMVCDFTTDVVHRLFSLAREDRAPRNDFESLKAFVGKWRAPIGEEPEALYKRMLQELPSLLDVDGSAVFIRDLTQRKYTSLSRRSNGNGEPETASLCENGTIVQGLLVGKPFVFSSKMIAAADAGSLNRIGGLYYFPIIVHGQLDGILCIADRDFTTSETHIISALCRQTALSIENNHLRLELYRKFDQFVAISEMTKAIMPIQNFQLLLRKILDQSAGLLKAEQGSLMLIDQETEDLLLSVKKGAFEGLTNQLRIHRGEGIAGRVAACGEALLVEDLEHDRRIRHKNRLHYKTRSFVSIPLKIGERVIGVLNLSDKMTGEVFNEEDLNLIQAFATHAAIVMDRNVFLNKTEKLEKLTITDPLTGLSNRRYLFERLKEELARSERHGHLLSLLMLDLDGFKQCNDTRGHLFGDKVLKDMALTIVTTIRSMDIASRYGGDEFIVILPETGEKVATDIAERLRANVEAELAIASQNNNHGGQEIITASIGIACYPKHGTTIEHLLKNVDSALYLAKKCGKNRIAVFQNAQ